MAKELGMNPKKFGKIANEKQEPWKRPLPAFIEHIYLKRSGRDRPSDVKSIEEVLRAKEIKKEERRKRKESERKSDRQSQRQFPDRPQKLPLRGIPQYSGILALCALPVLGVHHLQGFPILT